MDKKQLQTISWIIILTIIASGVGYYIYNDIKKGEDVNNTENIGTTPTNQEEISNNEEIAKSDDVAIDENTIIEPPLERPVIILADLSEEQENEARKRMAELSDELRKDSGLRNSWLELASYRRLIGDYMGAEEIWLFMTKKWPTDEVPYINLGDLYHLYTPDFSKAEEYYLKALDMDAFSMEIYVKIHEFYTLSYTEHKDKLKLIIEKGLSLIPGDKTLLYLLNN